MSARGIKTTHLDSGMSRVQMKGRTDAYDFLKNRKLDVKVKTPQGQYKGSVKISGRKEDLLYSREMPIEDSSLSGRKLSKREIKKIHKFAEKLKKHSEIEEPFALATYMHQKGYDISGRKPLGYVVSGTRVKDGRYFKTWKEARKELDRQMKAGATSSGIMEIHDKSLAKKFKKSGRKFSKLRKKLLPTFTERQQARAEKLQKLRVQRIREEGEARLKRLEEKEARRIIKAQQKLDEGTLKGELKKILAKTEKKALKKARKSFKKETKALKSIVSGRKKKTLK